MSTIIVLAMHGIPPEDFPRGELGELFRLHAIIESQGNRANPEIIKRHEVLDKKIRHWPRTELNDPYYKASLELAKHLADACGQEVITGFNEFCAPSLEDALEQAADGKAARIIVVTTMMTRGGSHSEKDIPAAIKCFSNLHPDIDIKYAWPFDSRGYARFLSEHLARFY